LSEVHFFIKNSSLQATWTMKYKLSIDRVVTSWNNGTGLGHCWADGHSSNGI